MMATETKGVTMQYAKEFDIYSFEWWAGAMQRLENATPDQREEVSERIEEVFYDVNPTETDINDYVWFECDDIFFDEGDEDDE